MWWCCLYTHSAWFINCSSICTDVDECENVNLACHATQVCINTYGSYHCSCFRGYYSDGPGQPCRGIQHLASVASDWKYFSYFDINWNLCFQIDINECLQRPPLCSYNCHNLPGDFECICAPGSKRLPDRKTCAG